MDIVCGENSFLKNPQKLPLNKLYLQHDYVHVINKTEASVSEMLKRIEKSPDKYGSQYSIKSERKSAIDKYWIHHNRKYVNFKPYYVQFEEKENSQFLEKNEIYLDCINFFVTCTFQQFWCYVVYEPRFATMVIDFLENAISPFTMKYLSSKYLSLYSEIYSCIHSIYRRLINFFVSETEYIEEATAIKHLRKSNLISSRVIMNFCYLFEHDQKEFVEKLVKFCYSSRFQDIYLNELSAIWDEILHDLHDLSLRSTLSVFNPTYVEETAYYLVEASNSLLSFTNLCVPAVSVAIEQQFVHRIPHIYQKVYSDLYDMCDMKCDANYDLSKLDGLINEWLPLGRQFFIELSHNCIQYCLNHIVKFRNQQREQEEYLEIYLALISTALDDDFFIRDYNEMHPVKEQFNLLEESIPHFDTSQTDYLLQSLMRITVNPQKKIQVAASVDSIELSLAQPFPQDLYESIYTTLNQAVPSSNQSENVMNAIKKYEQLKQQWELNPNRWIIEETPDTFLEDSFEEWEDSTNLSDSEISKRIATVKEMFSDLNDDHILQKLKYVNYKPELVISHLLDESSSLPSGSVKIISYTGKKPQHSDAKDLLDDKKEDIKNLVLKASYTYEVDDDYDDRNEIYNSFEPDNDSKLNRNSRPNNSEYNVISDPSSSEDEASADIKPRDAFCEDPAVIRARRAAQRGRVFTPSHKVDVGQPKTKGQADNVKGDRDKKNVHKSSRANHNRKGGAQWKRSRGMMPS